MSEKTLNHRLSLKVLKDSASQKSNKTKSEKEINHKLSLKVLKDGTSDDQIANKVETIFKRFSALMLVVNMANDKTAKLRDLVADPIPYLTDGVKSNGEKINWGWWSIHGLLGSPTKLADSDLGVSMELPRYKNLKVRFTHPQKNDPKIKVVLFEKGKMDKLIRKTDGKPVSTNDSAFQTLEDIDEIMNYEWDTNQKLELANENIVAIIEEHTSQIFVALKSEFQKRSETSVPSDSPVNTDNIEVSGDSVTHTNSGPVPGAHGEHNANVFVKPNDASNHKIVVEVSDTSSKSTTNESTSSDELELRDYDVMVVIPCHLAKNDVLGVVNFQSDGDKDRAIVVTSK